MLQSLASDTRKTSRIRQESGKANQRQIISVTPQSSLTNKGVTCKAERRVCLWTSRSNGFLTLGVNDEAFSTYARTKVGDGRVSFCFLRSPPLPFPQFLLDTHVVLASIANHSNIPAPCSLFPRRREARNTLPRQPSASRLGREFRVLRHRPGKQQTPTLPDSWTHLFNFSRRKQQSICLGSRKIGALRAG